MNKAIYETLQKFPELKNNFQFVGTAQQRNIFLKEVLTKAMYPEIKARYPNLSDAEFNKKLEMHVKGRIKNLDLGIGTKDYAHSIKNEKHFHPNVKPELINGISMNSAYAKDTVKLAEKVQKDIDAKYHPPAVNKLKFIIDHEIGHQLDDLLKLSKNKVIIDLYNSLSQDQITAGLSEYAWKNTSRDPINEFIAEAWGEYRNNPPSAIRPIARQVGELIEKEYLLKYGH